MMIRGDARKKKLAANAPEVLAKVLAEHRLGEPGGGTAAGSFCRCSCGETIRSRGVRETAGRQAIAHVAAAQVAALEDAGLLST